MHPEVIGRRGRVTVVFEILADFLRTEPRSTIRGAIPLLALVAAVGLAVARQQDEVAAYMEQEFANEIVESGRRDLPLGTRKSILCEARANLARQRLHDEGA